MHFPAYCGSSQQFLETISNANALVVFYKQNEALLSALLSGAVKGARRQREVKRTPRSARTPKGGFFPLKFSSFFFYSVVTFHEASDPIAGSVCPCHINDRKNNSQEGNYEFMDVYRYDMRKNKRLCGKLLTMKNCHWAYYGCLRQNKTSILKISDHKPSSPG